MQKKFTSITTILLSVAVFWLAILYSACNKPAEIGADFFTEESFALESIDSFALKLSMVIRDSLATSNSNRILVGRKVDSQFGSIQSSSFFELAYPSLPELDEDFSDFDSITLLLDYDGYYYYDTLQSITYFVHQLLEEMEVDEETDLLYSDSDFPYNEVALGQKTFFPRPLRDEPLEIRLSDDFGLDLYQKIIEEDEVFSGSVDFLDYIKGFVVRTAETDDSNFLGFSSNSGLRIYYTDNSTLPSEQKTIEINRTDALNFNQITSDRSGTLLADLEIFEEPLAIENTNNQAFLQNGSGIELRVEIPNLRTIKAQKDDFLVSKATLTLFPEIESISAIDELPSELFVTWVDEENETVNFLEEAFLIQDFEFNRDTRYTLDVTSFVDFQLNREEQNQDALLFTINNPVFNASVDQLIFGNSSTQQPAELEIFLVELKE